MTSVESVDKRKGAFTRAIIIALLAFAILVGAIGVAALLGGEQSDLPFEYEGFD